MPNRDCQLRDTNAARKTLPAMHLQSSQKRIGRITPVRLIHPMKTTAVAIEYLGNSGFS
jgi:hypothetical protein